MWKRSVGSALLAAVGGTVLAGEGAERYEQSHRVEYIKQHLQAKLQQKRAKNEQETQQEQPTWMQTPQFPYLVALSPGDNHQATVNGIIGSQALVLGSYDESTGVTLQQLMAPSTPLESWISQVAQSWSGIKSSLHGDVPDAFDPRKSELDMALEAIHTALQELHASDSAAAGEPSSEHNNDEASKATRSTSPSFLVFFLRDIDHWSERDHLRAVKWSQDVTSKGLAHVLLPTTSAVTPSTIQRLQNDQESAFVAVLIRIAKATVDSTTAEQKLLQLEELHGIELYGLVEEEDESEDEWHQLMNERRLILKTAGNWWADLELICLRLAEQGIPSLSDEGERMALIQQVCYNYEQEIEIQLIKELQLDGSLAVLKDLSLEDSDARHIPIHSQDDHNKALNALESWRCLEVITGVATDSSLMASPQSMLSKGNNRPLNCVSPVDALLPFGATPRGEQKFLELIDHGLISLRPKNGVEIGVIPCETTELIAPCWIEIRPIVKNTFINLWRNDVYFHAMQELERYASNKTLEENIALYEQEIIEQTESLRIQEREFKVLEKALPRAERAKRKAELAIQEVELQAKAQYLDKLRTLLTR